MDTLHSISHDFFKKGLEVFKDNPSIKCVSWKLSDDYQIPCNKTRREKLTHILRSPLALLTKPAYDLLQKRGQSLSIITFNLLVLIGEFRYISCVCIPDDTQIPQKEGRGDIGKCD